MSDQDEFEGTFEQDGENDDAVTAAAETEAVTTPTPEEQGASDEDFFPTDNAVTLPDPAQIITVQTSSGGKNYVTTETALPVSDVLAKAGIHFVTGTEFWLNGAKVELSALVPPAQTLMVVPSVKGG
jgi:hypothetical protein